MTEREFDRVKEATKGLSKPDLAEVCGYLTGQLGMDPNDEIKMYRSLADTLEEAETDVDDAADLDVFRRAGFRNSQETPPAAE